MRSLKIILNLLVCLLLFNVINKPVLAEERNIYIGDLITLEVKTKETDEETLKKAFEAFEIVDIHETKEGYSLTLRTFEAGDYEVVIGNQPITISVQSTLDDLDRKDIFEGDLTPRKGQLPIPWLVIDGVMAVLFVISGTLYLLKKRKTKKSKNKSPYEKFLSALENVQTSTKDSLVEITIIFKNYLEELFHYKIIGKTSAEMIMEIEQITQISGYRESISSWLKECDSYKFSGCEVHLEQKEALLKELKKIGSEISQTQEVAL
ncbi:MAG: hypothetical protein H7X94_13885 [Vallitaleaceae bacterium]|nr:hypothetical protein [Vallitaleaceae bacterium]